MKKQGWYLAWMKSVPCTYGCCVRMKSSFPKPPLAVILQAVGVYMSGCSFDRQSTASYAHPFCPYSPFTEALLLFPTIKNALWMEDRWMNEWSATSNYGSFSLWPPSSTRIEVQGLRTRGSNLERQSLLYMRAQGVCKFPGCFVTHIQKTWSAAQSTTKLLHAVQSTDLVPTFKLAESDEKTEGRNAAHRSPATIKLKIRIQPKLLLAMSLWHDLPHLRGLFIGIKLHRQGKTCQRSKTRRSSGWSHIFNSLYSGWVQVCGISTLCLPICSWGALLEVKKHRYQELEPKPCYICTL